MVGAGIVEIDRLLDEAQAEVAGVEAEIADRIAGNRGDVVQSGHGDLLSIRPFRGVEVLDSNIGRL